jgi:predicted transcriptional regulator
VLTNIIRGKKMEEKTSEKSALTNVIETELDILKRHINILKKLQKDQPMGIIKLSEITGYPQHMVRYSLRILEQDGIIEPSSKGAITTDKVPYTLKELKKSLKNISILVDELIKELD